MMYLEIDGNIVLSNNISAPPEPKDPEFIMVYRKSLYMLYNENLIPKRFRTIVEFFGNNSLCYFENKKLSEICNRTKLKYYVAHDFMSFCNQYNIFMQDDMFEEQGSWSVDKIHENGRMISYHVKNIPCNPYDYTGDELIGVIANAIYNSNDDFRITIEKIEE